MKKVRKGILCMSRLKKVLNVLKSESDGNSDSRYMYVFSKERLE